MTGPITVKSPSQVLVPLPENVLIAEANSEYINVNNVSLLIINGVGETENILGGNEGQFLRIITKTPGFRIMSEANTRPGRIITNTGLDKTLLTNVVYSFSYYDGAWYESL